MALLLIQDPQHVVDFLCIKLEVHSSWQKLVSTPEQLLEDSDKSLSLAKNVWQAAHQVFAKGLQFLGVTS